MIRHSRYAFPFLLLGAWLIAFVHTGKASGSPIVINEILAGNAQTNLDVDYTNYSGWIELHNTTSGSINLAGYKMRVLRDGQQNPMVYTIPTGSTLPPGGHILIWADEKAKGTHAIFELDMDGNVVALLSPNGAILDEVTIGEQEPDVSYGRTPNGGPGWAYYDAPTPAAANTTPAFSQVNFAATPQFSTPGGRLNGPVLIQLSSTDPGAVIRYTTDGSRPTQSSPVYSGSIAINATTVVRARAWVPGKMVSPTVTQSYLINIPTSLPVVSIVTDPANLFDPQIGIYVAGKNGARGCAGTAKANWNKPWTRAASIEFFEISGGSVINQEVGIEIHGHCTRSRPRKSLEIKARKVYGDNDMDYAFFSDKPMSSYKRLILRNAGQDSETALMRDALVHNLAIGRMDLDRQAYRPAVVYLNGQYWGIHNMREKMDEDYVENNYDLEADEFDMLRRNGEIINGSPARWAPFFKYIQKNNPALPNVYATIDAQMDIDAFIDYMIMQTYVVNLDWPGSNVRYWDDIGDEYRWRWVLNDFDYAFGLKKNGGGTNTNALSRSIIHGSTVSRIMRQLLKNTDFRNEFAQRYAVHLNTTFAPTRVIDIIDSMAAGIRPEIPAHIARWGKPATPAEWEKNINNLRVFAANRPAYARLHLFQYFGNPPASTLTININGHGRVFVAGAEVHHGYSGPHLRNIPISLTAIPEPGLLFSRWLETGDTSPTITVPFTGNTTRTAVFDEEPPPPPPPPIVINEIHFNPPTDSTGDVLYEFLELVNTGATTVNLAGFTLTGIAYTLPAGTTIAAGEIIVVAKTSATYAGQGYQVLDWSDDESLNNSGERIALIDTFGQIVDEVTYGTAAPWPAAPNNLGPSLSLKSLADDNSQGSSWEASRENGGTPGTENFPPLTIPPVVINEIHYNPAGGMAEFIELFNASPGSVDLSGFMMEGVELAFPSGATLDGNGYLVIAAPGHAYPGALEWTAGELADDGERIALLDATAQVVDEVTYGEAGDWPSAPAGVGPTLSLGNPSLDNSVAASWAASRQDGGTPGAVNFPPLPIVINELHYNPAADDDLWEFLELTNTGAVAIDLSGYQINLGISFVFPALTLITPGEYIVVAKTAATFEGNGYQLFQWLDGSLDNGGETVSLADPFGNVTDSVSYDDEGLWPLTPDNGGPSLSLLDPGLDNDDPLNWVASPASDGSPGAINFP